MEIRRHVGGRAVAPEELAISPLPVIAVAPLFPIPIDAAPDSKYTVPSSTRLVALRSSPPLSEILPLLSKTSNKISLEGGSLPRGIG
jgi:hypothetical protein